jgi:hypothetical protein
MLSTFLLRNSINLVFLIFHTTYFKVQNFLCQLSDPSRIVAVTSIRRTIIIIHLMWKQPLCSFHFHQEPLCCISPPPPHTHTHTWGKKQAIPFDRQESLDPSFPHYSVHNSTQSCVIFGEGSLCGVGTPQVPWWSKVVFDTVSRRSYFPLYARSLYFGRKTISPSLLRKDIVPSL